MRTKPFIAIDWGTTNFRYYVIDEDGNVARTERSEKGVLYFNQKHEFADMIAEIRRDNDNYPVLCAGMVGSNRGWYETKYVNVPADINSLTQNIYWVVPHEIGIIPGVSINGISINGNDKYDIMRGEEVQFIGAANNLKGNNITRLCQPGTHCKWANVVDGQIVEFQTAITGELFNLLKKHSLLSGLMDGIAQADEYFTQGLKDAKSENILTTLFGVRAQYILGKLPADKAVNYVSGIIIGYDVFHNINQIQKDKIQKDNSPEIGILADEGLGELYTNAIKYYGGIPILISSRTSFIEGIKQIWSKTQQ